MALRTSFGGVLLLGLEILVAADLITTVAVAPTLRNVAFLCLIVLIRTSLSVSLEVEIEGQLPWRRLAAGQPPALPGTLPGDPAGQSAYSAFTRPFNMTGQPAIGLPLS